jgi:Domain of unknown function (DUF4926)
METKVRLLDVVALISDIPEQGLHRGQVGTVVEVLTPEQYDVEFCDDEGRTYALATLSADQLLVLRYAPEQAE